MSAMVDRASRHTPRLSSGLDMAGLGARLRLERLRRRLSLYDLEARTGVSRSMLSEVERGSKVPTVLVLDRIATGLDTSIARLLGDERESRVVVLRRGEHDTHRTNHQVGHVLAWSPCATHRRATSTNRTQEPTLKAARPRHPACAEFVIRRLRRMWHG